MNLFRPNTHRSSCLRCPVASHGLKFKPRMPMASASTSTSVEESDDWDRPFTDEELQAIDTAFLIADSITTSQTASSSSTPVKKRQFSTGVSDDCGTKIRRRLPESLFVFQKQNANSFSLSPCNTNRSNAYDSYRSFSSSSQGNLKMRYQEMAFKGRIMYSRTFDEVEKSAEELLNFIEAKRRTDGHVVLGCDIEWRPTFRRGVAPRKAAVIQICGDNNLCYVFHICHSGIPQNLQYLLENPTSVKVGVGIANDASKIFQDHNVSVRDLEDLSDIANLKLGCCRKWSLSALTEMLICKQLPKPKKIRLGNWEVDILSNKQVQYAATDAFVSWYLYQVLKSLPEAADKKQVLVAAQKD
ncbi:hypothetical protein M9H77_31213 [Catharanthus roseus]|uniref:Uncharacterized protein n=1 Tax=Catharanthus roseus TaxID=4058 RepID=A0ACB9ZZT6_CATRO|nr:hypothetical protein M9H77_31213 [Catharanthus roseus]